MLRGGNVIEEPIIFCTVTELAARFERLGFGMVALDCSSLIVLISPLAKPLLSRCGISVVDNRVVSGDTPQSAAILALIAPNAPREASRMLQCVSGQWLIVRSALAPIQMQDQTAPTEYRVLALRDPSLTFDHDIEMLCSVFGLTRRESELSCHLAGGRSLAQFAECRHLSMNTTRTHLKQAYRKLEVRNQANLVALVLAALRG